MGKLRFSVRCMNNCKSILIHANADFYVLHQLIHPKIKTYFQLLSHRSFFRAFLRAPGSQTFGWNIARGFQRQRRRRRFKCRPSRRTTQRQS